MGVKKMGVKKMLKVLIICAGGISRLPNAHAIWEHLVSVSEKLKNRVFIDSSATHSYHVGRLCHNIIAKTFHKIQSLYRKTLSQLYCDRVCGSMTDYRVITVAEENNIPIQHLRARQISAKDYEEFDLLLAMDQSHMDVLKNMFPENEEKLMLFLPCHEGVNDDVLDPYFGEMEGFCQMFDIIHKASKNLIQELENDL